MAKKAAFEIYEGLGKRKKTFAVIPLKYTEEQCGAAIKFLKRVNHCSLRHIFISHGYTLNGLLYFGYPKNKKAKRVCVLRYIRNAVK